MEEFSRIELEQPPKVVLSFACRKKPGWDCSLQTIYQEGEIMTQPDNQHRLIIQGAQILLLL